MRTAGVDLSVADKGTAASIVEWEQGSEDRARVGVPSLGLDDAALLDLLPEVEWTAIDAPFGWPEPMVAALHAYSTEDRWPAPGKQSFRLRRTDLHVHDRVLAETGQKLWPLSPSTDRISLTAWRLAGLREAAHERSRIRFDRAGGDQVVDAVLCALIARAAALGQTEPPPAEALDLARVEGWIHLPRQGSLGDLIAQSP